MLTGFTRKPDQRGWFCSELVAELYRRLGWLPRQTRASSLVPGHFGSRHMRLQHGKLGAVEFLKAGSQAIAIHARVSATTSAVPVADTPAIVPRTAGRETLLPPQSHAAG